MSEKSTALAKRSASDALMAPPPAPKRIKRPSTVLDEDAYTSAVAHIIRRDFFPGLEETDAQREYLDALESKNKRWIREAGNKLTEVMTPVPRPSGGRGRGTRFESENRGRTPSVWGVDTPRTETRAQEAGDDEGLGRLDKADLELSLGGFQAKYTSEDQESFNQILDRHNKLRFEKNRWLREGNRFASKQRIAQQKVIEARKSGSSELVARPSQNLDDRPAAPNTHKHSAFNTLMFGPDSIESWAPTHAQAAQAASLAPPKRVLHANTRLPAPESEPQRSPSPTASAVRDAIAGRPRLNPSEAGYAGSETPRVNGYAFVDARPPSPSSDSDAEAPTDLLEKFGAKGSTSTPFTISESQRREKLHHKMVERLTVSKRAAAEPQGQMGKGKALGVFASETPRFLSAPAPAQMLRNAAAGGMTPGRKAVGNLTPAAQRLFHQVGGGTPRGEVRGGFGQGPGSGAAKAWTPAPRKKV